MKTPNLFIFFWDCFFARLVSLFLTGEIWPKTEIKNEKKIQKRSEFEGFQSP
jgi:hypothetical protein